MQFGNTSMAQLNSDELSEVVQRLCSSFEVQCSCYTQLDVITRRAAGALAMSRGDFTEVLSIISHLCMVNRVC